MELVQAIVSCPEQGPANFFGKGQRASVPLWAGRSLWQLLSSAVVADSSHSRGVAAGRQLAGPRRDPPVSSLLPPLTVRPSHSMLQPEFSDHCALTRLAIAHRSEIFMVAKRSRISQRGYCPSLTECHFPQSPQGPLLPPGMFSPTATAWLTPIYPSLSLCHLL